MGTVSSYTNKTPVVTDKLLGTDIGDGSTSNFLFSAIKTLFASISETLINKTINTASNTITVVKADMTDFDSEVTAHSAVTANTAKVTNATHTGDVTGATALTIAADKVTLAMTKIAAKTESLSYAMSDNTTALETGTKYTFYMPYAFTVTEVRIAVLTAPTGSQLIVDVHEAGVTIMATNKADIDIGEFTSEDAAQKPVVSAGAIADNAKMELIIDQIGSTVAGAGLVLTLSRLSNIMGNVVNAFIAFPSGSSPLSYEELFGSDPAGWTSSGAEIAVANSQIEMRADSSGANLDGGSIDLANASNVGSNLSDTLWTVDFTYECVVWTLDGSNYILIGINLSDSTTLATPTTGTGDEFEFNSWNRNTVNIGWVRLEAVNGGSTINEYSANGELTGTGIRYVRMVRKSATTFSLLISPNKDWTSASTDTGTLTVLSTIIGLQYFKVETMPNASTSGVNDVDISVLRVYDGVDRGTTDFDDTS